MAAFRVWLGLIVLVAVSLAGDWLCRGASRGGDQERLLRVAGEGLTQLPATIGKWRATELEPFSDRLLGILRCRSYQHRAYVDEENGESVAVTLLVGPAGPMVAHTPEVCYESTSYDIVESPRTVSVRDIGDQADTFNQVVFRSKGVAADRLCVHYAWHRAGGHWEAPRNPRVALGGEPLLFKLQLAVVNGSSDSTAEGADRRFLAELLPELDRVLNVR